MAQVSERLPLPVRTGRVLVVDDDDDILTAARLFLKQHVALVQTETDPSRLPARLAAERFDVVLLDMNFTKDTTTGKEGFLWLDRILALDPGLVVILITAYGDMEMAVRAIKQGATDFVVKPWQNEKLLATLNAALELRSSRSEANALREGRRMLSDDAFGRGYQDLIGAAPNMLRVFDTIEKVAASDANVLILGENGTGKELVARALHRRSGRADEVFVSVDMGAVSETLFDSELFGHVRGAFTDARQDKPGRFEVADGGTLFLDEIGNLSLTHQARLLSALEQRQVRRLGSNQSRAIDIRLICATNRPLGELASTGQFRQDLLYRINTVEIQLPPLRERREDIPRLAEYYLRQFAQRYGKRELRLAPPTVAALQHHTWPGNVRELQHAVERAVILAEATVLQPQDFFIRREPAAPEPAAESHNLDLLERQMIEKVLKQHGGNIKRAAAELGLTRASLYRRMEKYGF